MKKFIFLFSILYLPLLLFAQHPGGNRQFSPEQRAQRTVERLSEKITLTQIQKDSIVKIYLEFYDDVKAYNAREDEKAMALLEQTRNTQIQQVLANENKYKAYLDYLKEMQEKRKKREQEGGGFGNQ